MITIAIIEDNRLLREGMTEMLNGVPDLRVVLAAPSIGPAQLQESRPQVVLIDAGLQVGSSLELAKTVKQEWPTSQVIVMDLFPTHEEVAQFVKAGVIGFILKDATFDDLVTTIRSAAAGVRVLPAPMTGTLFSQIAEGAVKRGRDAALTSVRLTAREREVMGLIALGMSNKEIAHRLDIATHTVKSHVRNVMEKLTLHTRLQIAAYAHDRDDESGHSEGAPAVLTISEFGPALNSG